MSIEVELSEVCDIRSGGTPSRKERDYYGGSIPWAKIGDLERSYTVVKTEEYITEAGLRAIRGRIFPEGTLLFAIYGSMGKMAFAGTDLSTNQAILGVQPLSDDRVDLRYLYYYLSRRVSEFKADGKGVAQKNLSAKYLRSLKVPLPPIQEQRRVAAILDTADNIRRKREHALAMADTFLGSTFLEFFGDPVGNPLGHRRATLGDVASFISGGTPSKKRADYWDGSFPWVSPKDMKVDLVCDAEDHVSEAVFSETSLKKIPTNTPLIVVRGMILAHTVPIALTQREVAINQDMKAVKFNSEIDPVFGFWSLKVLHNRILSQVDTAAHGTKRIDTSRLQALPILVPGDNLQGEFVAVTRKFAEMRARLVACLSDASQMFDALSQRAFRGEL